MSPAPVLKGYVCRFCGNESIETPWDEKVFHCSQELGGCGVTDKGPLLTVEQKQQTMSRAVKNITEAFKKLGDSL